MVKQEKMEHRRQALRWHMVGAFTEAANVPGGVLVRSFTFGHQPSTPTFLPGVRVAYRWTVQVCRDTTHNGETCDLEEWRVEVGLVGQHEVATIDDLGRLGDASQSRDARVKLAQRWVDIESKLPDLVPLDS